MTRSNRITFGLVAALCVGGFATQSAMAGGHRHYRSYSNCGPRYYAPVARGYCGPTYYAPTYVAPVVYRPAYTYAAPVVYSAPVVSYPAPVYYSAPVYRTRYVAPYRSRGFALSVGW